MWQAIWAHGDSNMTGSSLQSGAPPAQATGRHHIGAATEPLPRIAARQAGGGPAIDRLEAAAYQVPTDRHESDGTLEWDRTTLVVVTVGAGGVRGIGYSYASAAAAMVASETLAPAVIGGDLFDIPRLWSAMVGAVRNIGRPGIAATAISAVDIALWDLKARSLSVALADLIGRARDGIPAYGSGGFTSYDDDALATQLGGWASDGFGMVKMKVGREQDRDPHRVEVARSAIGPDVRLFVDANGAYDRKGALAAAETFAAQGVSWFEEPVSSDDVDGLRFMRDHGPAGMRIAAGEYGWDQFAFERLLDAGAVDVLQADATRCLGVSGFLIAASLCEAHGVPLSAHCAPTVHLHLTCAARPAIHLEWFHDHARIEQALFDGAPRPVGGRLTPDRSRSGLGIELREDDAKPYRIWQSW
jgi:L-alanine-DL-glutamate epimerase-like enolase superfamily enzyme